MNDPHTTTLVSIPQEPQPWMNSPLVGVIAAGANVLQFLLQAVQAAEPTFWAQVTSFLVTLQALTPLQLLASGLGWYVIQRWRETQRARAARLRDHQTRIDALEARAPKSCTPVRRPRNK